MALTRMILLKEIPYPVRDVEAQERTKYATEADMVREARERNKHAKEAGVLQEAPYEVIDAPDTSWDGWVLTFVAAQALEKRYEMRRMKSHSNGAT
jgi:hypothetical protein